MQKKEITWKFHPRVFNSLGADLVTDDIVAIIELVKNAYDAGADKVIISFTKDIQGGNEKDKIILEIIDNGHGMTEDIINDVWFTVATPYKEINKTVRISKNTNRTVSGEKGLGRLSTARLGNSLEIYTKSETEPPFKVSINWDLITGTNNISDTGGTIEEESFPYADYKTGTVISVKGLYKDWSNNEILHASIDELKNNLSRFISPFSGNNQFGISVKTPLSTSVIKVTTPKYLNYPIYLISGEVNNDGAILYDYRFNGVKPRKKKGIINEIDAKGIEQNFQFCGPFKFEFRVWDYDNENIDIFLNRFDIKKIELQKYVSYHKGISVYRDDILVLPKTDISRDWIGLDLRRISRIGARISNRQIIGYVSITSSQNPKIIDASNREDFKNNDETKTFKKYLLKIVQRLERLREEDRNNGKRQEPPFSEILDKIFPESLKDKVEKIIENNGSFNDILNSIREYEVDAENIKNDLNNRVYYYSRMAAIGTLSSFLIHEINGRTGDISLLHTKVRKQEKSGIIKWNYIKESLLNAENAVNSLESLSERFAPLAIKKVNRTKNYCDPVSELNLILSGFEQNLKTKNIQVKVNNISTGLDISPGEMSSIYFNLFSNAIF
jgi:signal transduction histidine kinase